MPGEVTLRIRLSRRALIGTGGLAMASFLAGCGKPGSSAQEPAPEPTQAANHGFGGGIITATSEPNDTPNATPTPVAPKPVVFLDPGHGGVDEGAIGLSTNDEPVYEKTITLALAQRTAAMLRANGFEVVLSRTSDELPGLQDSDLTEGGLALTPQGVLNDLQRRIDLANSSNAQVFLSIHLDANDDPSASGTSTYYDPTRTFGSANLRFARLIQQDVIASMHGAGYTTPDLGVIDDTGLDGNSLGVLPATYNHLVVLGPSVDGQLRATEMPGALNEALFLSNPTEATAAMDPRVQDLMATGYANAIQRFLSVTS